MGHIYVEHGPRTTCDKYLPKPTKRLTGLLSHCSYCGRTYRCVADWGWRISYSWEEVDLNAGRIKRP
jgi:hypothetical protein